MAFSLRKEEYQYTYADYLTWDDGQRWEIIDGVPYCMSPAPSRYHQEISGVLFAHIYNFLENKTCKVYAAPFDVRLSDRKNETDENTLTVVQPDIVVVCDEKKLDDRGCKGSPDLIIEILSPSTSARDMKDKLFLYEKYGIKEYWIVDPFNKIVVIYKPDSSGKFMRPENYASKDTIDVGVLKGLSIDLKKVFREAKREPKNPPPAV